MDSRMNTSQEKPHSGAQEHEHDEHDVQQVLEQMARAVTSGDIEGIAACWAEPALIVGDMMAKAINGPKDFEEIFGGAKAQYNAKGITDTRPDIQELRWISERVCMVEVRWPYLDAQGREMGYETSTYTLRRNESGVWKIRCATMHGSVEGSQRSPRS